MSETTVLSRKWTHQEAVHLCILLEAITPAFGVHVALTGGTLYRMGERKDVDILLYRIRQWTEIDMLGLKAATAELGITWLTDFGWVHKATWQGKPIDFFFPERTDHPELPDGAYL